MGGKRGGWRAMRKCLAVRKQASANLLDHSKYGSELSEFEKPNTAVRKHRMRHVTPTAKPVYQYSYVKHTLRHAIRKDGCLVFFVLKCKNGNCRSINELHATLEIDGYR